MKKKSLRIILSLALCVMVMTTFSVTAFAAGDVSGAIESTWNAAKSWCRPSSTTWFSP